ncbi:MAG: MFS transporter, partial [Gammaproteobacteria bacterium]
MRIERNVGLTSAAMLLLSLGESLWSKFLPKYLQALGAPAGAIGAYGTAKDFLDGIYQYPGGWLSDRFGRKRALLLFVVAAMAGYAIYAAAVSWQMVIAGLVLVMAWSSMASPALFAVVGDSLPKGKRAIGFTIQALLRRFPLVIAPILGGMAINRLGVDAGTRSLLVVNIALGLFALIALRSMRVREVRYEPGSTVVHVWTSFPRGLRLLLISDVFARICEGLVDVFLVLYATQVVGISAAQFGILVAVQSVTSMLVYLPAAYFADRAGRKPVVIATFLAFAAFPLAVVSAHSMTQLMGAFVVGGLREIGEPARKSMIVDFAHESVRARSVGLYYL